MFSGIKQNFFHVVQDYHHHYFKKKLYLYGTVYVSLKQFKPSSLIYIKVNMAERGSMVCKCIHFAQDLLNLSKDLLSRVDQICQWNLFECFLRQYLRNNEHTFTSEFPAKPCTLDVCRRLLRRIVEFKRSGMKPSTFVVNLISLIYFKNCGKKCCCVALDLQKTTVFPSDGESLRVLCGFGVKPNFMKVLMEYGYLTRLSKDSPLLIKESCNIMRYFM